MCDVVIIRCCDAGSEGGRLYGISCRHERLGMAAHARVRFRHPLLRAARSPRPARYADWLS